MPKRKYQTIGKELPTVMPTELAEIQGGQDLENILQCPICFEILSPPIYICIAGHSICQACKIQIKKTCPTCRKGMGTGRNYALEDIFRVTKFSCHYKDQGCEEVPNGSSFKDHVSCCLFGPIHCPFGSGEKCKVINSSEFFQHVQELHCLKPHESGTYLSNVQFLPDSGSYGFGSLSQIVACWAFDGHIFMEQLVSNGKMAAFNILILGDPKDAKKYKADFHLLKKGFDCAPNIQKGVFPIEVFSVREPQDKLEQKAVSFPVQDFATEVTQGSSIFHWITRLDLKKVSQNGDESIWMTKNFCNEFLPLNISR